MRIKCKPILTISTASQNSMKFTPCSAVIRKVILPGTANFLSVSIFSLCSRCRVNPFQMKSLISLNILFLLLLNPPLPSNDTSFFLKDGISCSTHLSISVVPYRIISIMVTDFWPAMALMLTFHITRQMKEPLSMKANLMADRGYESFNTFAHLIRKGMYFVIRMKDINSNGILSAYDLPDCYS